MPPEDSTLCDDDIHRGDLVFSPLPDANAVDFDNQMRTEIADIVRSRQMHSRNHTPSCFKYGTGTCRLRFPRQTYDVSHMDPTNGVINIKRDDAWLNAFNPWLSLVLRSNHDVQFLLTKNHALAIMYYVVKYISKSEQKLHSKLAIAAAIRSAQMLDTPSNTSIGKQMIQKVYNKIESHREVGLPEAISHLLTFPDNYTGDVFTNINTTHLLKYFKATYAADIAPPVLVNPDIDSHIIVEDAKFKILNIFDDYRHRGSELARYCMYDYSSIYYKAKGLQGVPFSSAHPQSSTYSQISRLQPFATPNLMGSLTYLNPHSTEDDTREDFYCIASALFVPWGLPLALKDEDISWEIYFHSVADQLPGRIRRVIENIDLLYKSKEESQLDRLQMQSTMVPLDLDQDLITYDGRDNPTDPGPPPTSETLAAAIRAVQNTADLYTLEAIDAGYDYGFFDNARDMFDIESDLDSTAHHVPFRSIQVGNKIQPKAKSLFSRRLFRPPSMPSVHNLYNGEHIPPSVSIHVESINHPTIDRIISHFTLNVEQSRALKIICNHSLRGYRSSAQLRMGIFGEGGTGKSRLIHAIRAWFRIQACSDQLVITATTGSAACNIGGTTLHSAMGIAVESGDKAQTVISASKMAEWINRRYLIIDEVSMLDRSTMIKLDKKLKALTCNGSSMLGGMNIIFCGDFLQLPTVNGQDLYIDHRTEYTLGYDIWRSLNAVVILRQQMRQAEDKEYAELLSRCRRRQPTDEDIAFLNSRIGAALPSHAVPTVIVRRHSVRKAINNIKIVAKSEESGSPITYSVAHIVKRTKMHNDEIFKVAYKERKAGGDAILALVPGIPLMVTTNIDISLSIVL